MSTTSIAALSAKSGVYAEVAGKAALIAVFAVGGTRKVLAITTLLHEWGATDPATRWTYLTAQVCALAFIVLIIVTTFIRHRPLRSAEGLEPRLSALGGTFLAGTLGLLPPAEIPLSVTLIAVGMSAVGAILSTCVLLWLGRSFSVMAQARKLVTTGPYAIVRHPLYLSEELMAVSLMLLFFSPLAVLIAIVHWGFQLRRMVNEERVLGAEYPEYASYAATTPRVLPRLLPRLKARPVGNPRTSMGEGG